MADRLRRGRRDIVRGAWDFCRSGLIMSLEDTAPGVGLSEAGGCPASDAAMIVREAPGVQSGHGRVSRPGSGNGRFGVMLQVLEQRAAQRPLNRRGPQGLSASSIWAGPCGTAASGTSGTRTGRWCGELCRA
jgi:hypothetical protein